ncbi:hypothetical protein CAPTEDRAFT_34265, partial [Capitella teleta]
FHRAARDGFVDILKEASRKDCNRPDEDDMTPTLWAAFHGNLESLRLIVSRGGDPDRTDHLGCTALHHAASRGHLTCVSFLLSFGANLWSLDNDFRSALDLAALNGHRQVMQFLDRHAAQQLTANEKAVRRRQQRAQSDAEKRVSRFTKRQSRAAKEAAKQEQRFRKDAQQQKETRSLRSVTSLGSEPMPYSAHFTTMNSKNNKTFMTGVAKKLRQRSIKSEPSAFKVSGLQNDGTKTIRSLSGLRRDSHVMYMRSQSLDAADVSLYDIDAEPFCEDSLDDVQQASTSHADSGIDSDSPGPHDFVSPPGFGSIAFMNRRLTQGTLKSLPAHDGKDSAIHSPDSSKSSVSDSIGTVGSLAQRIRDLPWEDDDPLLDDDDEDDAGSSLELFLASNALTECLPLLHREKIDMSALMLASEADLRSIGLPLGTRLKLLDAVSKRKDAMQTPGELTDTML